MTEEKVIRYRYTFEDLVTGRMDYIYLPARDITIGKLRGIRGEDVLSLIEGCHHPETIKALASGHKYVGKNSSYYSDLRELLVDSSVIDKTLEHIKTYFEFQKKENGLPKLIQDDIRLIDDTRR